jgi:hypothetical protein
MTTSSSAAFPALSPMPLMVASTWRAIHHTVQGVRYRHTQIVVAMDADGYAACRGYRVANASDESAILLGHCVARGIRDVEHGRAGIHDGVEHLDEIGGVGASCIFGVEFHVVRILPGEFDGVGCHLQDLDLFLGEGTAIPLVLEFSGDVDV